MTPITTRLATEIWNGPQLMKCALPSSPTANSRSTPRPWQLLLLVVEANLDPRYAADVVPGQGTKSSRQDVSSAPENTGGRPPGDPLIA